MRTHLHGAGSLRVLSGRLQLHASGGEAAAGGHLPHAALPAVGVGVLRTHTRTRASASTTMGAPGALSPRIP